MVEKSANFVIRIKSQLLHNLVQAIALRAYRLGYEDARLNLPSDPDRRVFIDPKHLRKFV